MLKQHATGEEKENLDFELFDASNVDECIYGQMTGHCQSKRANELMALACKRIFHEQHKWKEGATFQKASATLNGAFKAAMWTGENRRNFNYISALEGYLMLKGAKNAEIIAYIKGKSETLELV